jgi:hypothetical protein
MYCNTWWNAKRGFLRDVRCGTRWRLFMCTYRGQSSTDLLEGSDVGLTCAAFNIWTSLNLKHGRWRTSQHVVFFFFQITVLVQRWNEWLRLYEALNGDIGIRVHSVEIYLLSEEMLVQFSAVGNITFQNTGLHSRRLEIVVPLRQNELRGCNVTGFYSIAAIPAIPIIQV